MKTREYFVSKLQEHGLWDWFLSKFTKPDGSWEHRDGYDTGWHFSDSPPSIWYQQHILADPHEFGSRDREFLASTDPDDKRIVDFMREIGFVERTTRRPERFLPEVWPKFVRIADDQPDLRG